MSGIRLIIIERIALRRCDCSIRDINASDQAMEQLVPGGYRHSYSQQLQESFGDEKKTSDGLL